MASFTPGPWRAEYDDNGFFYIGADGMPSPYIVATGGEGDINEANAKLAASAPDLYEALTALIEECASGPLDDGGNFDDRIRQGKAALAKANGEVQS